MKKTIIFLIVMLCSIVLLVSCGKQIETGEVVSDTTIETSVLDETTIETTKEETTTGAETEKTEITIKEQPITETIEEHSPIDSTIETILEETTQPEYSLVVVQRLEDNRITISKTGDEFPEIIYEMGYYYMKPWLKYAEAAPGVLRYFGEYNSAHVVYFHAGPTVFDPTHIDVVDGFTFIGPNPESGYTVYKEGDSYSITEAFERGMLTHEDLEKLHSTYLTNYSKYSFEWVKTEEITNTYDWYEKHYIVVDISAQPAIEETTQVEYSLIVTQHLSDRKIIISKTGDEFPAIIYEMIYCLMEPHGDLAKSGSLSYCGEYSSSHVVLFSYGLLAYLTNSETVDGFTFVSPYYNFKYTVYKEGETYSLTEAFEKGILTHNDLEELYSNYIYNRIEYSYSLVKTDELEDTYAWYEKNFIVVDSLDLQIEQPEYSLVISS